jgi:glycosyltransferase involved in cell wall biosynthesis
VSSEVPFHSEIERLSQELKGRLSVLTVCLSHSWGGLEQVAATDALEVGSLGVPMRVLCLDGSPIHNSLRAKAGIELQPVAFEPRDFADLHMRTELRKQIESGVNLIHTHQTSLLGSIVPWIWKSPQVALIATRHIMSTHNKRDIFHGAIYSRVDALLAMSHALKRNILDTHPVPERKVPVVNLGLDFERFDPAKVDPRKQRAAWGADDDTVVIGVVGRIDRAKCQDIFLKAGAGLLKNPREGERLKFVIVGEETLGRVSNYLEELREMVKQFHMTEDVVFAGYQENIPEVMKAFDIFVMPSRQETFGLVAIEAMAMESPIVISSGGSASEIVGPNGEYGMLVRPRDAFDLQLKLRFLLDNPLERIQMGQRAREHVRANYDRRARVLRTLEIYDRALSRRVRRWGDR